MYDFSGYGGKEDLYEEFCRNELNINLTKDNSKLHDFLDENGTRIELKKQQDANWIDSRKYSDLSDEDRKIKLHFLVYKKGQSDVEVWECNTGDFVDIFYKDEDKDIARAYYNMVSSTTQIKKSLHVKKFIKENNQIFKKIF
jgi:hypothetical protein|tara:strand:- start:703 stop:1128 length:426 start_codon:yes stop_codon:yes gene_type:complete